MGDFNADGKTDIFTLQDEDGGGICNESLLALSNSTFSGNKARGCGGGIFNFGSGTVTLRDSTLNDNSALDGGGLFNSRSGMVNTTDGVSSVGSAMLTNVTASGNRAIGYGGGLANFGAAIAFNTTIAFNQADSDNDSNGAGGGVYNEPGATFAVHNSLVAGNLQGNGTDDCDGVLMS